MGGISVEPHTLSTYAFNIRRICIQTFCDHQILLSSPLFEIVRDSQTVLLPLKTALPMRFPNRLVRPFPPKPPMKSTKLFIFLSLIMASPTVRSANIIDSIYGVGAGSFELPGFSGPTFATYNAGSTAITGWTVNTVNIDWVKTSVWNASNGNYSIDMNGTPGGPGGIQTVISTTVGSTYRVSFDIAGYLTPGSNTNPKVMKTMAGGITTLHYLTATQSYSQPFALPLAVTWSTRSVDFIATSNSSTVSFVSLVATDGSAMLLDNVSIQSVPEPGITVLIAVGVAGLVMRRRRQIRSLPAL